MSLGLRQTGVGARSSAIIAAAQAVVAGRQMITRTGLRLSISDPDMVALRRAITAHTSAYPDAAVRRTPDGIQDGLINPWYLPRH